MAKRVLAFGAATAVVMLLAILPRAPLADAISPAGALPVQLTGPEFVALSTSLSEPDGYFRSDNLVSNEIGMQEVMPDLLRTAKPGRAYLGVGPEQNFTYIAALAPAIAFVVDIRRGNLQLHLMYKALFHLSRDRAEFVSRLFSMKRPPGLSNTATAHQIFDAYHEPSLRSEALFKENLAVLRSAYGGLQIPVTAADVASIEDIYRQFFDRGLAVQYEVMPGSPGGSRFPGYADMMTATDSSGIPRSYLATEENFLRVKTLQERNLIVPVVGNFAGPKTIRAIARYLKSHSAVVSAFYVSNVEQYLGREGVEDKFCGSASTLPMDESSTFIRSQRGGFGPGGFGRAPGRGGFGGGFGAGFRTQLVNMRDDLRACVSSQR